MNIFHPAKFGDVSDIHLPNVVGKQSFWVNPYGGRGKKRYMSLAAAHYGSRLFSSDLELQAEGGGISVKFLVK